MPSTPTHVRRDLSKWEKMAEGTKERFERYEYEWLRKIRPPLVKAVREFGEAKDAYPAEVDGIREQLRYRKYDQGGSDQPTAADLRSLSDIAKRGSRAAATATKLQARAKKLVKWMNSNGGQIRIDPSWSRSCDWPEDWTGNRLN